MTFKYKKQLLVGIIVVILCVASIGLTYLAFGQYSLSAARVSVDSDDVIIEPTTKYYDPVSVPIYEESVADPYSFAEEEDYNAPAIIGSIPYAVPPAILYDDGSPVWEGLTLTELTNKLNKSLKSYVTNTGYFFARYTKTYGLDPYLAVSILLLETGCGGHKGCSKLAVNCNNFGGITGGKERCKAGGRFRKYNSIDEGLQGFMDVIYKNYYSKGDTTPEDMAFRYADGSTTWAGQVQGFYNSVKNK